MTPAPAAKLEPDAISVAQDTVIGMASSAPAASIVIAGVVVLLVARFGWRSSFFALPREADTARHQPRH